MAGGGSGFLRRRSIAFTRVSSRTPGDGSFLGRKQLGQRRRLTYLPQGNHEPEGVAQKPDSEKPRTRSCCSQWKPHYRSGSPIPCLPGDAKVLGCLLVTSLNLSPGRGMHLRLPILLSASATSQGDLLKAPFRPCYLFRVPSPELRSVT